MIAKTMLPRNAFEAYAISWGGRRGALFGSWAVGLVLAGGGALMAVVSCAAGVDPLAGIVIGALGLLISGAGWLITAATRFGNKPIQPVKYPYYAARRLGGSFAGGVIFLGIAVLLTAAAMVFAPRGFEPDVLPIYGLMLGLGLGFALYGYVADRIITHCPAGYAAWLARTGGMVPPPPPAFYRFGDPTPIDPDEVYAKAEPRQR